MKSIKYSISIFVLLLLGFVQMFALSAEISTGQFSYRYKNELVVNNQPGVELNPAVESIAMFLNKHLNQSILFDGGLLRDIKKTRAYHVKPKPAKELVGQGFDIFTDDGVKLGATYFDRGSDSLLIIASGFTNERELMSPFVSMFPDYDVVIFDFRGHGYRPFAWTDPETWPLSMTKQGFGIDASLVRFGHDEDKDVFAVVDGFKKLRQRKTSSEYKNVYGLGLCYGAFVLTKTQSVYPGLFDKLVLDGCWLSLEQYIDKVRNDFYIMCNPQSGGWKHHPIFTKPWAKNLIESLVRNFILELNDISLIDYAPKITNTPILMFYGKDDYTVARNEFEQLWNLLATHEKTAMITSNDHVRNHLKQKELYKLTCDLFFQHSQERFVQLMSNEKELVLNYARKITGLCEDF